MKDAHVAIGLIAAVFAVACGPVADKVSEVLDNPRVDLASEGIDVSVERPPGITIPVDTDDTDVVDTDDTDADTDDTDADTDDTDVVDTDDTDVVDTDDTAVVDTDDTAVDSDDTFQDTAVSDTADTDPVIVVVIPLP